jgi:hypothetical protein
VAAARLQDSVARELDDVLRELLDSATLMWSLAAWCAYDHREVHCTVQLYRWCGELIRSDRRFTLLNVQLEWLNLTPEMLAGTESIEFVKRPDLRVYIGSVGRSIECKRLASKGDLARRYVHDGMARFVADGYGRGEPIGYMVGYIQSGAPGTIIARVNTNVRRHPDMGEAHQLGAGTATAVACWHESRHVRASDTIRLRHLLIDMTTTD